MPVISIFLGIKIYMFFRDHNPPHVHAYYGDFQAIFSIATGHRIEGDFPSRQEAYVTAWVLMRQTELIENWKLIQKEQLPKKIEGLK